MGSDSKIWKLGIIGWPLGYSLSPLMHTAALKAAGLQGEYKEYPVKPEDLENWLKTEAPKLDGFNATMPHKEAVFRWLERTGEISRPGLTSHVQAVNTVKTEGNHLIGWDTDGDGFLAPFSDLQTLRDKRLLLLGAGGAAKAIAIYAAAVEEICALTIWNRHKNRADELADIVSALPTHCQVHTMAELNGPEVNVVDVIVNATPMGMAGKEEMPAGFLNRLHKDQVVYDIVYEPRETKLIQQARKKGCRVVTGDEMLAGQGAVAFKIWTGKDTALDGTPILDVMRKALGKHFAKHAS